MGPVELILLGRTLMKLGEQALPATPAGGERTVVIVMSDVYEHPGTTVGEIADRTGLPQSAVSGAVARLREAGSVLADPDPADRRRQLLRRNPSPTARQREVAAVDIGPAVATALGEPSRLPEVLAALEVLGRHLTPQAASRPRSRR
ncbi:MarR family transcriptional regulator [Dactylosporangium aurantiacum]|uniref:MarR family transcriptional regulator n=1 Tax=Dactylosporangium aurantiacum TaxID=35754 RepID=A0A9Q9ITN0_9ACTN|nr:helix-turn-helix domain-containing protein [Dactylosporangium aurantiacum]MDG6107980.1 helix-turn-helix domain-containing protein [Dactylosporangium aurantiacum]UWZ59220.1 MarR family transcriptional regulator [Dactylosporangium aurantiacum]